MIPLSFWFTVVQATAAVGSAILLAATTRTERTIKLPIANDEALDGAIDASSHGNLGGEYKDDPFDVATPLDFMDGIPIDEGKFWVKMHNYKALLAAVVLCIVALGTVTLGWLLSAEEDYTAYDITSTIIHIFFASYLLIISAWSIAMDEIDPHWVTVIHIWSLSTVAVFVYSIRLLLPKGVTSVPEGPVLAGLDYATFALYIVVFCMSFFTPRGPDVHFPPERIYSPKTLASSAPTAYNNVTGYVGASIYSILLFSYVTRVVMLGYTSESLEIRDLPIVPSNMRATAIFSQMRRAYRTISLKGRWKTRPGSGWGLLYKLFRVNWSDFALQMTLAAVTAVFYYLPAYFLQSLVRFLEIQDAGGHPEASWGWVYCAGLFLANAINYLITGQLWSISTSNLQVRLRVQLNTLLFSKTLVRKDIAGAGGAPTAKDDESTKEEKEDEEKDFSSKAQIMTLMTTDVDRVSEFSWHVFSLVDAPIEIIIGSLFLYRLLGVSCFFGLGVTCLFLPLNHFASKIVIKAQDNLMKSRDERVSLMNEVLGGIRMLKFMAWERSFERRVMAVREKELFYQKRNYYIEVLFNLVWEASPVLVTLVSFFHFAVIRKQVLTPSIAFTSLSVFNELKFALNALPETFINMLQSLVSLRRIENYLSLQEVSSVPSVQDQADLQIVLRNATVSWPKSGKRMRTDSATSTAATTPMQAFQLIDLTLEFPKGEMTLICGKLGSGKTLLLLALLGEADVLTGQLICPRTPPDVLAHFATITEIDPEDWVVEGTCAYVPQSAWLQNASIKENILFSLPYDEHRYHATLEACALTADLKILEDGDEAEIGERGVNLSGGQKARVSLARAIYSRAAVLFLDDVLSAVDAETAQHIYEHALKGPLLQGRTVILVSHHVQLCAPGASYVVALNNGRLEYAGSREGFQSSEVMKTLVQTTDPDAKDEDGKQVEAQPIVEEDLLTPAAESVPGSDSESTAANTSTFGTEADLKANGVLSEKKKPRKLVEEEMRVVGRIKRDVWEIYVRACGGWRYWFIFITVLAVGALRPVVENGWLRYWSSLSEDTKNGSDTVKDPLFYISVYAALMAVGLVVQTLRWFMLYRGSLHASSVLYKRLLKSVLFAHIRFHDTTNRGRLLNRFGKDFEGIDSSLADNFGRTLMYSINIFTTFITITYVGGWAFLLATAVFAFMYFEVAKVYGQTSRDMRRLDSVTRSPLYTIYGESISGVAVLRAFGAGSKFLREMQQHVDTNTNPYYWMWGVNRWLSCRFNLLSSGVVGITGVLVLLNKNINASFAGFALAFASGVTNDLLFTVRRFVGLEQSMVAMERVKEFSELPQESAEFIEPRPPASWPHEGAIQVENLVIKYAPDLPSVLHGLTFDITPRSKIGVLGRTGGGKSTLALSFFRFVEATEGKITIDGVDISKIGLTDLRSRLTIIPQDPTILSGTLRSTLDVFDEYTDAGIFEALRRVHLIPSEDTPEESAQTVNANTFRNLDSNVSEGGENFSAGEKQLICMARAILKRSKVLFMDEATASVDYATDELISKTIRAEFADSTILTIAHRLRTVIDYDKVILLDKGQLVEFDRPSVLLADHNSKFYSLCKSTGKAEFTVLKRMAEEAAARMDAEATARRDAEVAARAYAEATDKDAEAAAKVDVEARQYAIAAAEEGTETVDTPGAGATAKGDVEAATRVEAETRMDSKVTAEGDVETASPAYTASTDAGAAAGVDAEATARTDAKTAAEVDAEAARVDAEAAAKEDAEAATKTDTKTNL
ncbi:hypothetical protein FRB93_003401 [Tulasnella sp. JGI-2019a]|nr:hypothetical protein FRB93_003401 [Tulasnella sp. JGI-2019a]